MRKSLQTLAAEVTPATIGAAIVAFQNKCNGHAEAQISLTNEAREIGLLVQAWCGHEQLSFEFWQRHRSELPKEVSYSMLKTFVSISHRLPSKADKLEDARRVWQQTFESVGLLEITERTEAHKSSAVTRYTKLINQLGVLRNLLVDWNRDEPFESWSADTRASVAGQLKPLAELYQRLIAVKVE